MKVAVIIPGQARFFRNNDDILKIINEYNADVFIHTWERDDNTFIGSFFHNKIPPFTITKSDILDYINKYKPKKFLVEKELTNEYIDSRLNLESYPRTSNHQTKYNLYSYLYSLNKCINLIDNISDYDFIIPTRSDMDKIIIPNLHNLDKNIMITPPISDNPRVFGVPHLTVDLTLSIIPAKFVKIYGELINKLDEYYNKGYDYAWEEMFYAHINETNILKDTIQLKIGDIYFEIKRDEQGIARKHILF
jgi:hypothetical protein